MAQSAVFDAVITTDLQRPTAEMAAVATPTLVLQGDPTWPILATAADGIARRLPNARHRILPVEAVHGIDPDGTAAAIRHFEQWVQQKGAVKGAIKDMETANVDISTIRVLQGEKGVQILIQSVRNTALGTHSVRWLLSLGYPRNILDVYEAALDKGESLIRCPVTPRIAALWAG